LSCYFSFHSLYFYTPLFSHTYPLSLHDALPICFAWKKDHWLWLNLREEVHFWLFLPKARFLFQSFPLSELPLTVENHDVFPRVGSYSLRQLLHCICQQTP